MNPTLQALFGASGTALSASGRNGDSMMAHLSPRAAATLKRAGGAGTINPATGAREYFNAQWYLQQNPDVAADPYFSQNPEAHWQAFGQSEGRPSDPPGAVALTNSQIEQYFGSQPDIQAARAADPNFNLAQWYQTSGQGEVANGTRQMAAPSAPAAPAAPRYSAPSDIQALWNLMTPQQQQNAAKQAGWSGGIDDSLNQWVASGNQSAFENAVKANRYSAPTAVQQRFDLMSPQQRDAALAGAGWTGGSNSPDLNQWALNNRGAFEGAIMNYGVPRTQTGGLGYGDINSALTNLTRYFSTQSMMSSNPFGSVGSLYGGASPFFQQSGSFGSGAGGNYLSSLFGAGSQFGSSATSGSASATTPSANPFGSGSSGAFAKSSRSAFPTQTGLI